MWHDFSGYKVFMILFIAFKIKLGNELGKIETKNGHGVKKAHFTHFQHG